MDMERGQIAVFAPLSQKPSFLPFLARMKHAPKHLRTACLVRAVLHFNCTQPFETAMWSMFTHTSAFLRCWCEGCRIVFSGVSVHHPSPRTCSSCTLKALIIHFYFHSQSCVYLCMSDAGATTRRYDRTRQTYIRLLFVVRYVCALPDTRAESDD